MSTPFSFGSEKEPPDVQLKLIDIQCDLTLKEVSTFKPGSYYGWLNTIQFTNLCRRRQRMFDLFDSICVCQQTSSVMNYTLRYRSRLRDEHLSSVLHNEPLQMAPDGLTKRGGGGLIE